MTIVETSVWVDVFRGRPNAKTEWLDQNLGRKRLALTDLILCEVLQGVRSEAEHMGIHSDLLRFTIFDTGGTALAEAAAVNYRLLRKRGITIRSTIDCLIATFCIREGHSLLHNDRDYDPFERHLGLKVIHP